MSQSKFAIPDEYRSELRYVDSQDRRDDAEILEALTKRVPITSEKNVWTYWHAGVLKMPAWCQRNVANWVRLLGPSWTVRVLDTVPDSANHALSWLDGDQLPRAFIQGKMTGPYVGPHSADFLRGAALFRYGGVWTDVGTILFRHLDKICWDQLADESSPFTVSVPWLYAHHIANAFVAARKGDEFVKRWHQLFMHLWKDQNDYMGVIQSPLVGFMQDLDFEDAAAKGLGWDFQVDGLTVLGYTGQVVAWIRLALLIEPDGGFNGVEYFGSKVLLFDALEELWAAEKAVGFAGSDFFSVLTTRLDADPESEEYKRAYAAMWRLLTKSSVQKITHGKGLTKTVACGTLLDLPENEGADVAEGTFAELMRHGSVHFEQTRDTVAFVDPIEPGKDEIIHKGMLEA